MFMIPVNTPVPPKPQTTRPTMKAFKVVAEPQTTLPASKIIIAVMNKIYLLNKLYNWPLFTASIAGLPAKDEEVANQKSCTEAAPRL